MRSFRRKSKKSVSIKENKEDVNTFLANSIEEYHRCAKMEGYAKTGVIIIPELMPIGEKTCITFLNDTFFQMELGNNPKEYYYAIMMLCFQAGIDFAAKWNEDVTCLNTTYIQRILDEGPSDTAERIMNKEFGWSKDDGTVFYNKIYKIWLERHAPYWELSDPRQYTFSLMMAAYQLGISIILDRLGY